MRTNLFCVWMQRFACKWTESNLGITSAPFSYANQKRAESTMQTILSSPLFILSTR